jgi:hypothetical protein
LYRVLGQVVFAAARSTRGAFEMLEPREGRLFRTVLRGLGASNGLWLPDARIISRHDLHLLLNYKRDNHAPTGHHETKCRAILLIAGVG